jgi:hypothetical protein
MLLGLNGVEKPAQLFYSFKQINSGASIHLFVANGTTLLPPLKPSRKHEK